MKNKLHTLALLAVTTAFVLPACTQKMGVDGHLRTYVDARVPPEGTIARGQLVPSTKPSLKQPTPISLALLERGRQRYNIYCSPCHDYTGAGQGMIVQRGFLAPPSYHIDRLKKAPDSHFFDVITNGYGAMYRYADRVSVSDRWAIIAYIRALQLSQNVVLSDPSVRLRPDEIERIRNIPEAEE